MIMKENILATIFFPNKYAICVQSKKIGNHNNKIIHSTLYKYILDTHMY